MKREKPKKQPGRPADTSVPPGPSRVRIPPRAALVMIGNYVGTRIREQIRAVAFIVVYLAAFWFLALGSAPAHAWRVAAGIGLVVLGLTLFLEGLFLGLMPLGELVGLQLPRRGGLIVIAGFGLLLGFGSTLAEPAVAALRAMSGSVKAWEAPLLFALLERDSGKLVAAIGIGVGIAVAAGMFRLYFGISIKPFIYVLIPFLLAASVYCGMNNLLAPLLGLAWDAGAVTTGPVTVPLVLALGIGVSRTAGRRKDTGGGFGIIMLASAFPILTVLGLGILLSPGMPRPMPPEEFFAAPRRAEIMRVFPSEEALPRHVYQRGDACAREAWHGDPEIHRRTVAALADPDFRRGLLGNMPLSKWMLNRASEEERAWLSRGGMRPAVAPPDADRRSFAAAFGRESFGAVRSVVPLAALLLLTLTVFLRARVRHADEIALGLAMSLIGMAVLTGGMRAGLVPLGDGAGRALPDLLHGESREEARLLIKGFDTEDVFRAYDENGGTGVYFLYKPAEGPPRMEAFDPGRYDYAAGVYEHVLKSGPRFPAGLPFIGIGLVLLFAFGMGYGSTLAEPALNALGRKVEEISVGTVRGTGVVRAVSAGVGLGLVAGVARIVYDIPTLALLAPPYLILLWLTRGSDEDFAGIAWDCGGVTTGIVTVPLVMAMGLAIGGELDIVDGFGALAMASVYPVLTVMIYGIHVDARQRRSMEAARVSGDE